MKLKSFHSKFTPYEMNIKQEIIEQKLRMTYHLTFERAHGSGTQCTGWGHSSFSGVLWLPCPEERPGPGPRD